MSVGHLLLHRIRTYMYVITHNGHYHTLMSSPHTRSMSATVNVLENDTSMSENHILKCSTPDTYPRLPIQCPKQRILMSDFFDHFSVQFRSIVRYRTIPPNAPDRVKCKNRHANNSQSVPKISTFAKNGANMFIPVPTQLAHIRQIWRTYLILERIE